MHIPIVLCLDVDTIVFYLHADPVVLHLHVDAIVLYAIFRKWLVQVIDINTRGGVPPSGFMSIMSTSHFLIILYHGQQKTSI